jgi:hypothetical protein
MVEIKQNGIYICYKECITHYNTIVGGRHITITKGCAIRLHILYFTIQVSLKR